MKKLYLFCSRLWVFWIEIPLVILLIAAISFNAQTEGLLKLYPLIVVLIAAIIFVPIFFFRVISVSYAEIRYIGFFTSRDNALINEGKLLRIKMLKRGIVRLFLIGHDDTIAGFDWLKPGEDEPQDITLFRGKTYGGKWTARRILRYFGVNADDAERALSGEPFSGEYENVTVNTSHPEDGMEIDIKLTKTV